MCGGGGKRRARRRTGLHGSRSTGEKPTTRDVGWLDWLVSVRLAMPRWLHEGPWASGSICPPGAKRVTMGFPRCGFVLAVFFLRGSGTRCGCTRRLVGLLIRSYGGTRWCNRPGELSRTCGISCRCREARGPTDHRHDGALLRKQATRRRQGRLQAHPWREGGQSTYSWERRRPRSQSESEHSMDGKALTPHPLHCSLHVWTTMSPMQTANEI